MNFSLLSCSEFSQKKHMAMQYTDMRHLITGIRFEKYVFRRFRLYANVIECTYTNVDSTVQRSTHLGYMVQPIAPRLQPCTECYCTEHCRQLLHNGEYCNIILCYNIMGPLSYMRSVVDRNVVMRHIPINIRHRLRLGINGTA